MISSREGGSVLGDDNDCTISEAATELTVSATESETVVLQGSDTVQRDGNLERVSTYQQWCPDTTAPSACTGPVQNRNQFTLAGVSPVIPVQSGDRIEVTVEVSFN